MGVHIDTRVQPEDDINIPAKISSHTLEQSDLQIVVDGYESQTRAYRFVKLDTALIVPVKDHLRGIDASEEPGKNLTARNYVEPDPLLDQNAHQRWREISFAGVDNSRSFIDTEKRVSD
jgi:hypothetical protein